MPNWTYNLISQFSIDSRNGVPIAMPTPSVITGTKPHCLVTDSLSRWAYIPNQGSNNISQYSIEPTTGQLTPLSPPTVATGTYPTTVVIHPSQPWLYVVNLVSNTIQQFTINTANGELSSSPTFTINDQGHIATVTGAFNEGLVMDPTGSYLYTSLLLKNTIAQFKIDPTTGNLSALSPASVAAGNEPGALVMHPSGKWLYVRNFSDSTVQPFAINSGHLTGLTAVPAFSTSYSATTLTIDPLGQYLLTDGAYNTYAINQSSGRTDCQ